MGKPSAGNRPEGPVSWWALGEADQLFGRIRRYTRFVVFSKWSLLFVALVLTASLIAWPLLSTEKTGLRVTFAGTGPQGGKAASPVMSNPEYRGIGANGQQFKISSKTATQQTSSLVLLEEVEAQLMKENGQWNLLTAERAEYQQDKKLLDLFGNVTLIDAQGNSFTTAHATVEINTLHIYGNEEISGIGASGNILASGFEIVDNGAHIIFTRGDAPVQVQFKRESR